jgi:hypothetical protein
MFICFLIRFDTVKTNVTNFRLHNRYHSNLLLIFFDNLLFIHKEVTMCHEFI